MTIENFFLIDALKENIKVHEAGLHHLINENYSISFDKLLPFAQDKNKNVKIAFNFWDSWRDESNHEWFFYEGIEKDDWPSLAKIIKV